MREERGGLGVAVDGVAEGSESGFRAILVVEGQGEENGVFGAERVAIGPGAVEANGIFPGRGRRRVLQGALPIDEGGVGVEAVGAVEGDALLQVVEGRVVVSLPGVEGGEQAVEVGIARAVREGLLEMVEAEGRFLRGEAAGLAGGKNGAVGVSGAEIGGRQAGRGEGDQGQKDEE